MDQTHENLNRSRTILSRPSNKISGLVMSSILGIISIFPVINGQKIIIEGIVFSVMLIICSLIIPIIFTPISWTLHKFSTILRIIINPTILFFLYVFAVIPSGIYLRISGKDPMKLKFDKNAKTYWIERKPPGPKSQSLDKQF
tara:strand:- start:21 stop:449 length:429 start_codon:yes stop_codon:yes gene_type:complete